MDQRDLLCGLHARRAAPLVVDRPRGSQARLSRLGGPDRHRLCRVRVGRDRLLVGVGVPGADGRRVGRQLHAGAQGLERPGGGPAAVPGRGRPRGGRRRERRPLVRGGRCGERVARLALGADPGGAWRRPRLRAGVGGPAVPTAAGGRGPTPRPPRLPADSPQSVGARLLGGVLRPHVGDVRAARLGRHIPDVRGRPGAPRMDSPGARHRGQRDGAPRGVGQRMGQRAGHSIRPSPLHPRHHARLRRAGGRDRLQRGAAVCGRGRARAAVRDPDLVGLVVADRGERRQRGTRPARGDARRPLHARLRRRVPRSAGTRRDARSCSAARAWWGGGWHSATSRSPCSSERSRSSGSAQPILPAIVRWHRPLPRPHP